MPCQIYIAPRIGSGMIISLNPADWTEATGPKRSLLYSLVDVQAGEGFDEIVHPTRNISICTVTASGVTLDLIETDSRVRPVIPIRATNMEHLNQILDALFSMYPQAWRDGARAYLESHGVGTEWVTGSHTLADVLRRVVKLFSITQVAVGSGRPGLAAFFTNHLDDTVSQIPLAQRQLVADWLGEKNIDASWITGATTIRQIVSYLAPQFAQLYGRDVKHKFAGRMF